MRNYKDYVQAEFLRLATGIIVAVVALFAVLEFTVVGVSTASLLRDTTTSISQFLDSSVDRGALALSSVADSPALHNYLESPDSASARGDVYNLMYDTVQTFPEGSAFAVLREGNTVLASSFYATNRKIIQNTSAIEQVAVRAREQPGQVQLEIARGLRLFPPQEHVLLLSVTPVGHPDVTIIVTIGEEGVHNFTSTFDVDRVVITDRFDNLVWGSPSWKSHHKYEHTSTPYVEKLPLSPTRWRTLASETESYFYSIGTTEHGNLRIYSLISTSFIQLLFMYTGGALILFGAVSIIFTRYLAQRQAARNLDAVNILLEGIDEWSRGNLDYRLPDSSFAEFTQVYQSFNHSFAQIENLLERNQDLAESKRALEIQNIEKKFNPHFVFNILQIIGYEARQNPDATVEIVTDFAKLLRYSIDQSEDMVQLSSDMHYIELYLRLQKARWGDRLRYSFVVEDDVADSLIPCLLIQPLVENALVHGGERSKELEIVISARSAGDTVTITVEDSGDGIDDARLAKIEKNLNTSERSVEGLGLFYVNRIVKLYFGDAYGLSIASTQRRGTTVTLTLPNVV